MGIKLSVKKADGYLLIKVSGIIEDFQAQLSKDEQLAKEIIKNDIKKIILDESEIKYAPNVASILNSAELVKFYSEELPYEMKTFKIATLLNQAIREYGDFWETYARNRGYDVKAVYTYEDALKYIESE